MVVRHVPADVCDRCGTRLYTGAVVEQLLAWLDEAARAGVTFQVREFTPVAP
jgi:FMN-dependent NADH-azoreductase